MYLSEDDIRTKVVYEWLKDCGFSSEDILVEYSLELHFGKTTKTFHPRTDVLIKSSISGKNLIIVEVKSEDHKLDNVDILQAISYACSLKDGIAPFTILTNGKESRLFDSVTRKEINNSSIPKNHEYVLNGFFPTSEGIEAKREAAEYLISLSYENLKTFCISQIEDRISILKNNNIFSGKKYIPSLYVEREQPQIELRKKLFEKSEKLLLVLGNPQQGKTCFICSTVEKLIKENHLCLFYPAISLRQGLLLAIKDDFSWCFGDDLSISQLIKKIERLCKKNDKKLFIFIDGWDEMVKPALELNDECKRLSLEYISIIISLTIPSLNRLLIDEADNLTFIGNESGLDKKGILSLGKKLIKDTEGKKIVQIGSFSEEETQLAKDLYKKSFGIKFMPDDKIFSDPFYLRITCELYSNGKIPKNLIRTEIIHHYLLNKVKRKGIGEIEMTNVLSKLGELYYDFGRPIDINHIIKIFGTDKEILPWKESGVLVYNENKSNIKIDFYNSNILYYTISVYSKKWNSLLEYEKINLKEELSRIFDKSIRKESLLWFLSCPENSSFIEKIFETIDLNTSDDLSLKNLLAESIIRQITLNDNSNFDWLENHLPELYEFDGKSINIIPSLVYAILKSIDVESYYSDYEYWIKTLLKYDTSDEDLGFQESYVAMYFGEIQSLDGYEDSSELDTDLFLKLISDEDDKVSKKAALYYAYCCFMSYLEKYDSIKRNLILEGKNPNDILEAANNVLDHNLGDMYYGYYMCKGWLAHAEKCDEGVKEEFYKMNRYLPNIIKMYPGTKLADSLKGILEDLKDIGCVNDEDIDIDYENPDQLKLDLE